MKRTILLGRKIRGDIGPTGIEPRTLQMGRIYAPAVSLTGVYQDYDQTSLTQHFTIGSRMVVDERTYHYARAALAIPDQGTYYLAVKTGAAEDIFLLTAAPAAIVGGRTFVVTVGAFQGGVVAANELVGGYVELWTAGHFMWRRITANTIAAAGVMTVTVDRPFNFNLPIGAGLIIHPSIYRATMWAWDAALGNFTVAVGMPPVPVPINHYYWLQTWGPCWIGPTGLGNWPFSVAGGGHVDLYYCINEGGSKASSLVNPLAGPTIGVAPGSPQRIGYALASSNVGTGAIMLQLAP